MDSAVPRVLGRGGGSLPCLGSTDRGATKRSPLPQSPGSIRFAGLIGPQWVVEALVSMSTTRKPRPPDYRPRGGRGGACLPAAIPTARESHRSVLGRPIGAQLTL